EPVEKTEASRHQETSLINPTKTQLLTPWLAVLPTAAASPLVLPPPSAPLTNSVGGVCLPSTCPHTVWLLEPTCCDNCPPPCHIPQPCVPTCFLLNSSQPTPGLETINLTTYTQTSCEPCIPSCC
uniref:4Fe-4S ferredoxin-type domain-containing protein n=1 Tax=Bos indicus x Bos taurus TaxID=30522 RepID=A0A4W2IQJ8_BOBOX